MITPIDGQVECFGALLFSFTKDGKCHFYWFGKECGKNNKQLKSLGFVPVTDKILNIRSHNKESHA